MGPQVKSGYGKARRGASGARAWNHLQLRYVRERNPFDMLKIKRTRFVLMTLGAALLIGAVAWRSGYFVTKAADPAKGGAPAVPVMTTTVKEQDVPTYLAG